MEAKLAEVGLLCLFWVALWLEVPWLVVLWLVVPWLVVPWVALGSQWNSCQDGKSLIASSLRGHLARYVGNTSRWGNNMDVARSNCRESPYSSPSRRALADGLHHSRVLHSKGIPPYPCSSLGFRSQPNMEYASPRSTVN
jgi:hypothetical protein